jgi:hypothetical protein
MSKTTRRVKNSASLPPDLLQKYLTESQITINRAPVGMQRQKTNRTRVTARKNVMWTIEWVLEDGTKHVLDDNLESATIAECFQRVQTKFCNPIAGNKRKRSKAKAAIKKASQPRVPYKFSPLPSQTTSGPDGCPEVPSFDPGQSRSHDVQGEVDADAGEEEDDSDGSDDNNVQVITETLPSTTLAPLPQMYFYLLRPSTPNKLPVVILLDPTASVTVSLRDRTVQEFPTIFVHREAPGELGGTFMMEEDFLNTRPIETNSSQKEGAESGDTKMQRVGAVKGKELDANSILEMLKRDVSR